MVWLGFSCVFCLFVCFLFWLGFFGGFLSFFLLQRARGASIDGLLMHFLLSQETAYQEFPPLFEIKFPGKARKNLKLVKCLGNFYSCFLSNKNPSSASSQILFVGQ